MPPPARLVRPRLDGPVAEEYIETELTLSGLKVEVDMNESRRMIANRENESRRDISDQQMSERVQRMSERVEHLEQCFQHIMLRHIAPYPYCHDCCKNMFHLSAEPPARSSSSADEAAGAQ